jgi:hypothetical protein
MYTRHISTQEGHGVPGVPEKCWLTVMHTGLLQRFYEMVHEEGNMLNLV